MVPAFPRDQGKWAVCFQQLGAGMAAAGGVRRPAPGAHTALDACVRPQTSSPARRVACWCCSLGPRSCWPPGPCDGLFQRELFSSSYKAVPYMFAPFLCIGAHEHLQQAVSRCCPSEARSCGAPCTGSCLFLQRFPHPARACCPLQASNASDRSACRRRAGAAHRGPKAAGHRQRPLQEAGGAAGAVNPEQSPGGPPAGWISSLQETLPLPAAWHGRTRAFLQCCHCHKAWGLTLQATWPVPPAAVLAAWGCGFDALGEALDAPCCQGWQASDSEAGFWQHWRQH